MTIPIAAPEVSEAAKEAVCEVLDSGMLADGEVVRQFEEEFAEFVGVDHAIACSSGTTALHTMLEAAGIGQEDVVLTSPFSFVASANAIVHAGAEPAFADVDPETANLDPERVREVLEERSDVTALMPVHLYGLPARMDEFRSIAREYDLLLFEDAAQAHGATFDGEQVGSLGDAGAFSFYPTKNMTTGEGGMVTTDDDEVAERARMLVNHGRSGTYEHEFVGYNYRMTNIQAAIGRHQIERLTRWVERRRENAAALDEGLSAVTGVSTPPSFEGREHAYHQYTLRTSRREQVREALAEADIGYGIYYPRTIPDQPAYGDVPVSVPVARGLAERVVSVPVHPGVDTEGVDRIVQSIAQSTPRVISDE